MNEERRLGFDEGRKYEALLDAIKRNGSLLQQVNLVRNNRSLKERLGTYLEYTLLISVKSYEEAIKIEERNPHVRGEAEDLFKKFGGEHARLCEILANLLPWGEEPK